MRINYVEKVCCDPPYHETSPGLFSMVDFALSAIGANQLGSTAQHMFLKNRRVSKHD